ncbi:uncharacterized protein LOC142972731 [Anticarsia gemmatalis]|uniref:uncharacterized protein LOC142972731 n=1 Tax=Anticarsia gemmatalis TaxID=129554 RepID=UPI003F768E55
MESSSTSSEDSFTWTDTSSDSIGSPMAVGSQELSHSTDSDSKHEKKRKVKKLSSNHYNGDEDISNSEVNVKIEKEHSENSIDKMKLVKTEPESDTDKPKKKKKPKHMEMNGHDNQAQDSASQEESYLDLKVKQEEVTGSKTKKKKKQSVENSSETLELTEHQNSSTNHKHLGINSDSETGVTKSKKKKKKAKRRGNSESLNDVEEDDKMDVEETLVQDNNSSRIGDTSITENSTFQDDSGSGEISAIQCEDDHNLHTFIEKEKKNESLYKSTILSQFKAERNHNDSQLMTQATEKRTPRISDRIRFEDDEDFQYETDHVVEHKEDKISSKLKKFIKTCNNVRVISQTFERSSILTDDDEVWVIKCPKQIDIQDLCDMDLNIQGKCKIKVGGQTYDGSLEDKQLDTTAALTIKHNKYQIDNLPLCGIINFRKRIPKAHFHDDNIMVNNQTNFIPLPETKCRHPLFGSNYKKSLKIPAAVAERLYPQNNEIVEKRKKKHKKNRDIDEDPSTKREHNMKTEPEQTNNVHEKKKKKRKHVDDEGPPPKKIKKIKHDPESAEAWDSEKAIEQNLFNF